MARTSAVVLCLFALASLGLGLVPDHSQQVKDGIREFRRTGTKNKAFRDVVDNISLKHMFRSGYRPLLDPSLYCEICDSIVEGVIEDRRNGTDAMTLAEYVISFCVNLNIESEKVCRGTVLANIDIALFMVDNKPDLTSKHLCSVVLQDSGCPSDRVIVWSVNIPEPTGTVTEPGLSDLPPTKILHISDAHYDPGYTVGALAACDEPVCCQADNPPPASPEEAAGPWGDYRSCDSPLEVIQDALDHITATHTDLDYVYFTGDIISHKVWATSIENNTAEISRILQAFDDAFSIPVFPILGNHEPHPLNVWVDNPTPQITTQWAFDLSATEWGRWLPEDTKETITRGGYYTALVKPGLRIIAINSNVCYTYNWWLVFDEVDPFGQLQWLTDTLAAAEAAGERVHILSHIPSGSGGCLKNWSKELRRILDRFSGTIAAMFNGHTHNDQFNVFYRADNLAEVTAVAFGGGSMTTYSDLNPNYKVYTADAESFEILDYEEWIYNITEANLTPDQRPIWFKEYTFKEAYGVERMRPQDMADLVVRMAQSQALLDQYYMYHVKEADTSLAFGCDAGCHLGNLCGIVTNEYLDNAKCEEITGMFNPQ